MSANLNKADNWVGYTHRGQMKTWTTTMIEMQGWNKAQTRLSGGSNKVRAGIRSESGARVEWETRSGEDETRSSKVGNEGEKSSPLLLPWPFIQLLGSLKISPETQSWYDVSCSPGTHVIYPRITQELSQGHISYGPGTNIYSPGTYLL